MSDASSTILTRISKTVTKTKTEAGYYFWVDFRSFNQYSIVSIFNSSRTWEHARVVSKTLPVFSAHDVFPSLLIPHVMNESSLHVSVYVVIHYSSQTVHSAHIGALLTILIGWSDRRIVEFIFYCHRHAHTHPHTHTRTRDMLHGDTAGRLYDDQILVGGAANVVVHGPRSS